MYKPKVGDTVRVKEPDSPEFAGVVVSVRGGWVQVETAHHSTLFYADVLPKHVRLEKAGTPLKALYNGVQAKTQKDFIFLALRYLKQYPEAASYTTEWLTKNVSINGHIISRSTWDSARDKLTQELLSR